MNSEIQLLSATQPVINDLDVSDVGTVVDGVSTIADSISKNGPLIVIGAVFIVLFICLFLLFLKINNDMIKNLISQMNQKNEENSDITQKLLDHFLDENGEIINSFDRNDGKENHETNHNKDLVGLFIDYTTAFRQETKKVINSVRCDRVAVYLFHNGNHTLYGLPFIKMSCVYEDTMKGIMTIRSKTHTNLPLHLFNEFVQALYKYGEFSGNLADVEIHDNSIREFLAYSDAKAIFMRAIKKEDGSLAGFTVCEFNEEINLGDEKIYSSINNSIKDMNTAIRYIVTDEEFSKKYEHNND